MDGKEEFTKLFLEEKVFNELKDVYFGGIKHLKSTYKEFDIDYDKVYRRIINYRIDKYGTSYLPDPTADFKSGSSRDDLLKLAASCRQRKYKRRRRESLK